MAERVATYVCAGDPISLAGVVSGLRCRPELRLVPDTEPDSARVAIVVADAVDEDTLRVLRGLRRCGTPRTILIATTLDETAVVVAAEAGVSALLRRSEATPDRTVRAVQSVANGDGEMPADLLGRLLHQVGHLQRQVLTPRGLRFSGLSDRETEVLKLLADGHDTAEIAHQLAYSERTVKNVLHDLTSRLQLRNRSHAVAYALREGLI